jgi:hypothetical protein
MQKLAGDEKKEKFKFIKTKSDDDEKVMKQKRSKHER